MIRSAAWVVWANARWAFTRVGYWIRPYDMLADARRWFWQPRQRCGWSQRHAVQAPRRSEQPIDG